MREDAVGQRDDIYDLRAARVHDHDAVRRGVRYCNVVRAAERDAVRAAAAGLRQRRDQAAAGAACLFHCTAAIMLQCATGRTGAGSGCCNGGWTTTN